MRCSFGDLSMPDRVTNNMCYHTDISLIQVKDVQAFICVIRTWVCESCKMWRANSGVVTSLQSRTGIQVSGWHKNDGPSLSFSAASRMTTGGARPWRRNKVSGVHGIHAHPQTLFALHMLTYSHLFQCGLHLVLPQAQFGSWIRRNRIWWFPISS